MIKFCYYIGPWIDLLHKLDFISNLLEANTDEWYRTGGRISVAGKPLVVSRCPECGKLFSPVIHWPVPIVWKIFFFRLLLSSQESWFGTFSSFVLSMISQYCGRFNPRFGDWDFWEDFEGFEYRFTTSFLSLFPLVVYCCNTWFQRGGNRFLWKDLRLLIQDLKIWEDLTWVKVLRFSSFFFSVFYGEQLSLVRMCW